MEATTKKETVEIKRTHKKPYKVGKLYFGRKATTRGAGWIVSASEDMSNPIKEFEIGKLARAYCEEVRDEAKGETTSTSVHIPVGTGLTNIFDDNNSSVEIV